MPSSVSTVGRLLVRKILPGVDSLRSSEALGEMQWRRRLPQTLLQCRRILKLESS